METLFDEGDQGFLLHFLGDFQGVDQPAFEAGEGADQPSEGEVGKEEDRQKDPHRGMAESPAEADARRQSEETGADDLGPRVGVGFIDHHRHDFAAGALLGRPYRGLDALSFVVAEEVFCFFHENLRLKTAGAASDRSDRSDRSDPMGLNYHPPDDPPPPKPPPPKPPNPPPPPPRPPPKGMPPIHRPL